MTQESILSPALQQAIGYESEPVTIEIDNTVIRRLAEAVEDPNPLWQDESYARDARYGSIVAPPSLLCTSMMSGNLAITQVLHLLPSRGLDGGAEYEILRPIHAGDSITVTNKLADIAERRGRLGPMLVITTEITWRNQRQEVVAVARSQSIRY